MVSWDPCHVFGRGVPADSFRRRGIGGQPFEGLGSGGIGRSACTAKTRWPQGCQRMHASRSRLHMREALREHPADSRLRHVGHHCSPRVRSRRQKGRPRRHRTNAVAVFGCSRERASVRSNWLRHVKGASRLAWRCGQSDDGSGAINAERRRWVTAGSMQSATVEDRCW